ncbi:MAG: YkgJ family cysteine cluster protein [Gammaproteobacteria bacterium]|nr:YkgJ family cysteine cluster protein [Gammaproteobacteria bacterium]
MKSSSEFLAPYGGCNACGRCCEWAGGWLEATRADLERWSETGDAGAEILRYAKLRDDGTADLWYDPHTGEALNHCPWLEWQSDGASPDRSRGASGRRSRCSIYADRPQVCQRFPKTFAQAVDFECEPVMVSLGVPTRS